MSKFKTLILLLALCTSVLNAENSNPLCESLQVYRDTELYSYLNSATKAKSYDAYALWNEQVQTLQKIKSELSSGQPLIMNQCILALASLTKIFSQRLLNMSRNANCWDNTVMEKSAIAYMIPLQNN